MDKKEYETWSMDIRVIVDTDIVRTSMTAIDKFDDGWEYTPGTNSQSADFVQ